MATKTRAQDRGGQGPEEVVSGAEVSAPDRQKGSPGSGVPLEREHLEHEWKSIGGSGSARKSPRPVDLAHTGGRV